MESAVERATWLKISEPIFQEAVFMEKQPETDEENEK